MIVIYLNFINLIISQIFIEYCIKKLWKQFQKELYDLYTNNHNEILSGISAMGKIACYRDSDGVTFHRTAQAVPSWGKKPCIYYTVSLVQIRGVQE